MRWPIVAVSALSGLIAWLVVAGVESGLWAFSVAMVVTAFGIGAVDGRHPASIAAMLVALPLVVSPRFTPGSDFHPAIVAYLVCLGLMLLVPAWLGSKIARLRVTRRSARRRH